MAFDSLRRLLRRAPERSQPPYVPDPEFEAEQNRESTPPVDERIELHCTYVAEAYLPSHAADLFTGMQQLGWDKSVFMNAAPLEWVRRTRAQGAYGGWANVGVLVREARTDAHQTDLPDGVDNAHAGLWAVTPSLTIVTVQFVYTDDEALKLDNVLRQTFHTRTTPRETGGWWIYDPPNQKAEALIEARRELRSRCGQWFAERLPGAFASGALGDWPAVDVITATEFEPLVPDDGAGGFSDYRELLHLTASVDVYENPSIEGLRLSLPHRADNQGHVATLAGRRDLLFSEERLDSYGGPTRSAFVSWLQHRVEGLAVGLACNHVLSGYQGILAAARDRALSVEDDSEATMRDLRDLRRSLLPKTLDAQALAVEMDVLCKEPFATPFRDLQWQPRGEHPIYEGNLGERWKRACRYAAEILTRTESGLREGIVADAQFRAAAADIQLQHRVTALTWASLAIAFIAAAATIVAVVLALNQS